MSLYDYNRWANFTKEDLVCRYTGLENPNVIEFTMLMDYVQNLRTWAGIPFVVSSGYRAPEHPSEARKAAPGEHTRAAIDFRVPTAHVFDIVEEAIISKRFTGIGFQLTGDHRGRFIHLDIRRTPRRMWSY